MGWNAPHHSEPGNGATCVYLTWCKSHEKMVHMWAQPRNSEQFQAYKHITLKTCFVFLDKVRTWCISGLSNKTVNGIISGFVVTTSPYFPRDPRCHYIWKSLRWVGWWAVRNTRLSFKVRWANCTESVAKGGSAPGNPSPLHAVLGSRWQGSGD